MKKIAIAIVVISTLVLNACKKDPVNITADPGAFNVSASGNIVTVKNLPADTVVGIGAMGPYGAGKYSFFNLSTNSKIASTDSATTNWDLAFAGTTIRINNVTTGPGNGGAFVFNGRRRARHVRSARPLDRIGLDRNRACNRILF